MGTGSSLGQRVLTNSDLEGMVETSDEWIRTRTGIRERRILREDEATSDLASRAGMEALKVAGMAAGEVDLIIVATVTPDMAFPSTASLVQAKIGARKAAAFDLSSGCTGFIYGLATAAAYIEKGTYQNIMVIGADTLSRIVDYQDRSTCVLFGDGAGAAVIAGTDRDEGILESCLGSNGTGGELLTLPAGGSRMPASDRTVAERQHYLRMDGQKIFEFAVKIMGHASNEVLERAKLDMSDVSVIIPHQANIRIIEAARKRFKVPKDKMLVNLDRYGNMSCGSIPVGLDEAVRSGMVRKGDIVLLVAFGAGLTWASSLIRWGENGQGE